MVSLYPRKMITKISNIFNTFKSTLNHFDLKLNNFSRIVRDEALAMAGTHKGLIKGLLKIK